MGIRIGSHRTVEYGSVVAARTVCYDRPMTNSTQREIDRLHGELAAIYRRGTLTPTEEIQVKGLWARIERMETVMVAAQIRDQKIMKQMEETK